VVNITVTVFYSVTSCRERQAAGSSKMLVHVYHSTWHHFPQDHHLHKALFFLSEKYKNSRISITIAHCASNKGRKSCFLNCHTTLRMKVYISNSVLQKLFHHESERKKHLFLTTFHG